MRLGESLDAAMERQRQLEKDEIRLGFETQRSRTNKAIEKQTEHRTRYGGMLIVRLLRPLAELYREDIRNHLENGKPGAKVRGLMLTFREMDERGDYVVSPEGAARIALREAVRGIARPRSFNDVAIRVGMVVEDTVRMHAFAKADPKYARNVVTEHRGTDDNTFKRKSLAGHMRRAGVEYPTAWTVTDHIKIGGALLSPLERAGLIERHVGWHPDMRGLEQAVLVPTERLARWLRKKRTAWLWQCPRSLPMLVPPKDWTGQHDGGLWFHAGSRSTKLMTGGMGGLRGASDDEIADPRTQPHIAGVNNLQRTAWRINADILRVAAEAWDRDLQIAGLPRKEPEIYPPRPEGTDAHPAVLTWKLMVSEGKARERKELIPKRIATDATLKVAAQFSEEDAIWFRYHVDYRGRAYANGDSLNPQGSDLARALLHFSEAKPLGSEEAVDWLKITLANMAGVDKVSYAERKAWVDAHEEHILRSAADPLGYRWWSTFDDKTAWQFLAACFEWAGYKRDGLAWQSRLPISLDATCSGLQHLSCLMRDEAGGEATNLVPGLERRDIYKDVAEKAAESLTKWAQDSGKQGRWARAWLEYGINRKITKRPTMTLPYGSKFSSTVEFIWDHLKAVDDRKPDIPRAEIGEAVTFLASRIREAINATVVRAVGCMAWIQRVAKRAAAKDASKPIGWRAPGGWPVRHFNPASDKKANGLPKMKGVQVWFGQEKSFTASLHHQSLKTTPADAARGLAPNLIHSLDASLLMLSVNRMVKELGLRDFHVVHDQIGVHACDATVMVRAVRDCMAAMYERHDVMQDFHDAIAGDFGITTLEQPPKRGGLDLNGIREARYSFS